MTQKKQWSDFTPNQQAGMVAGGIVNFVLLVAALWDIWHRPVDQINGDRRLWTAVSFVNFIGPLSYFVFGRKDCC
jgi:hypothetical protein